MEFLQVKLKKYYLMNKIKDSCIVMAKSLKYAKLIYDLTVKAILNLLQLKKGKIKNQKKKLPWKK